MQSEDFSSLAQLEASFWWFVGMRDISAVLLDPTLAPTQPRDILDIGCGTGGNLAWLRRFQCDGQVVGLDYVAVALQFCRQAGETALVQASATALPFAAQSFDFVTSFDVLVQLPGADADEMALREMYRVLKPGGVAFVRAAAYQWMRSQHDEALHSQRRYTTRELEAKLQTAGFVVRRSTYANCLLLPVAALHRLLLKPLGLAASGSDVQPLPPHWQWLNGIFTRLLRAEAKWLQAPHRRLPFGLSAICIAEKPIV